MTPLAVAGSLGGTANPAEIVSPSGLLSTLIDPIPVRNTTSIIRFFSFRATHLAESKPLCFNNL